MISSHGTQSLAHLLQTKLHRPSQGVSLVNRTTLKRLLANGLTAKLTLVTAPAGFGKSTLIGEWIGEQSIPFGWISLDDRDNDPVRFMEYLLAAVRNVYLGLGEFVLRYVQDSRDFSIETALTFLINEIQAEDQPFAIVLDDYHAIQEPEIHHGLAFLLQYLPRNMHVIVASRVEPALPLATMRAKRELVHITENDLRFTTEEIRALFAMRTDAPLTDDELDRLESRTEGWIAGLHMILLSGVKPDGGRQPDCEEINSFMPRRPERLEGDIAEYLAEEVLARQSPATQRFLLMTSVLERMNEPLCRHVARTERDNALRETVKAGLFVIPLDERRLWYRYHHLFGRLLYNRLRIQHPELVPELHRRACEWFRINGYTVEAVDHALAASEFDAASEWIEQEATELLRNEMHMLLRWYGQFPASVVANRPALAVLFAWTLATYERYEEAEAVLDRSEPYIDSDQPGGLTLHGEDIRGYFSAMRCLICLGRNETEKAVAYNEQIMERLGGVGKISSSYIVNYNPDGESLLRGRFGFHGGLKQALAIYPPLLVRWQSPHDHFYGYLHAAIGECEYERNELERAEKFVNIGISVGMRCNNPGILVPGLLAKTRICMTRGERDAAFALLEEARRNALSVQALAFMPVIAAFEARLRIRSGQAAQAADWADQCRLPTDGWIDPAREFEQITWLRWLAVGEDADSACRYAERLAQGYGLKNRKAAVTEIRIVHALVLNRDRKVAAALKQLDLALDAASTEGYLRMFMDEGAELYRLLTLWDKRRSGEPSRQENVAFQAYIATLISEFGRSLSSSSGHPLSSLTKQETNVLNLMAKGLTNKEIAAALYTSTETVKRHCKHIYKKLSVSGRIEAISLLGELQ